MGCVAYIHFHFQTTDPHFLRLQACSVHSPSDAVTLHQEPRTGIPRFLNGHDTGDQRRITGGNFKSNRMVYSTTGAPEGRDVTFTAGRSP